MKVITLDKDKSISSNTQRTIKDLLVSQVLESNQFPYYYSVLQFGFVDNVGKRLPPQQLRKYYDKSEVDRTCKLCYNMLKEAFNIEGIWIFVEKHADVYDEDGTYIKSGRFHLNIITTNIKDNAVEEPNRKCKRLFSQDGRFNIPIENNTYSDIDELKVDLFNACCRKLEWMNKFQPSIKTQILDEPIDLKRTINYCLKDFNTSKKVDFTQIINWASSDFYKP